MSPKHASLMTLSDTGAHIQQSLVRAPCAAVTVSSQPGVFSLENGPGGQKSAVRVRAGAVPSLGGLREDLSCASAAFWWWSVLDVSRPVNMSLHSVCLHLGSVCVWVQISLLQGCWSLDKGPHGPGGPHPNLLHFQIRFQFIGSRSQDLNVPFWRIQIQIHSYAVI